MDTHDLVTGIRWDILKHVCQKPQTGADLARTLGTSAANIAQHAKLLELGGLLSKERVNGKSMHYRIAEDVALVTLLSGQPERSMVRLKGLAGLQLHLLLGQRPSNKTLMHFVCQHEELVEGFQAFGVVKEGESPEILVIAPDVKPLRKEYASIKLGEQTITVWSHTISEIAEGLGRHEHYFVDMIKRVRILHDPDHLLAMYKGGSA